MLNKSGLRVQPFLPLIVSFPMDCRNGTLFPFTSNQLNNLAINKSKKIILYFKQSNGFEVT